MPFPAHSEPLSGLFFSHNALVIGFGADHYHKVGIPNLFVHPARPAFWRNDDILVDCAIDAVPPEVVGQLYDVLLVLWRVVTVADKNFGWSRRHLALQLPYRICPDLSATEAYSEESFTKSGIGS